MCDTVATSGLSLNGNAELPFDALNFVAMQLERLIHIAGLLRRDIVGIIVQSEHFGFRKPSLAKPRLFRIRIWILLIKLVASPAVVSHLEPRFCAVAAAYGVEHRMLRDVALLRTGKTAHPSVVG
ncbi:hypothetical protein C0063_07910 [Pseudoxanthomonas sp. KAs_5_3]|nr:hypothetical protein C0063_07910 [Pseudoxanthomonas sp. KAs_5_3]